MNCLPPLRTLWRTLIAVFLSTSCYAHDPGLSSLTINVFSDRIETELTFARTDIESVLSQPGEHDRSRGSRLAAAMQVARDALSLSLGGRPLAAGDTSAAFDQTNNFHIGTTTPIVGVGRLLVVSNLIGRMPRGHRQYAVAKDSAGKLVAELFLSDVERTVTVDGVTAVPSVTFSAFFQLGVAHILGGYDHLLFLLALLSVIPDLRSAMLVITSFTVAHSLTLGMATANWFNVGSKYTEPLIALTIVYVGIDNLLDRKKAQRRYLLTFIFGLIHGFGFASVLRQLGVGSSGRGIAVPLLSFNFGVETGQILIAIAILPLLIGLRRHPAFELRWVPAISAAVIVLGLLWFTQRTFF